MVRTLSFNYDNDFDYFDLLAMPFVGDAIRLFNLFGNSKLKLVTLILRSIVLEGGGALQIHS